MCDYLEDGYYDDEDDTSYEESTGDPRQDLFFAIAFLPNMPFHDVFGGDDNTGSR